MQLLVKSILIVSKNTTVEIQLSNRKEKKKMGNKETTLKEIFEDIDTSEVEFSIFICKIPVIWKNTYILTIKIYGDYLKTFKSLLQLMLLQILISG